MTRLPTVGGDDDDWGAILNDFLSQEHNNDGTLKIRTAGVNFTGSLQRNGNAVVDTTDSRLSAAASAVQSVNSKTGNAITLASSDIGAVPTASFSAKGDLLAATGSAAATNVAAGSNGQVLTADSTQTAGLKWSSPSATDVNAVHKGDLVYNVKDYGATGNGTTDDTTTIQAARDAAGTGGSLYFPAGNYKTTGLTASQAGQAWLISSGATIKLANASNAPTVTVTAANVTLQGPGTLDGNNSNQTSSNTGIWGTPASSNLTISRLTIANAYGSGIIFNGQGTTIRNCVITNSQAASIFGQPGSIDLVDITVEDNLIDRSMVSASAPGGYGIQIHGAPTNSTPLFVRRPKVNSNRVLLPPNPTNTCIGIELWGGVNDGTVDGNLIDAGTMGISLDRTGNSAVSGNTIVAPSGNGIELASSNLCAVTGNAIDGGGLTESGIDLDGNAGPSDSNSISTNTISGCTSFSIFVLTATHTAITGNTVYCINTTTPIYVQGTTTPVAMHTTITGNQLFGNNQRLDAIVFDGSNGAIVNGNTADGFTRSFVALFLGSSGTIDDIHLGANHLVNCAGLLIATGSAIIGSKVRYSYAENSFTSPGVSAVSVGSSPFTYTNNDNGPETLYISGGTVSAVAKNSVTIFASSPASINLEINESVTVTYSATPTINKDRK